MSALVQIYLKKIKSGEMSIEDVPIYWREEVREELEKQRQNKQETE